MPMIRTPFAPRPEDMPFLRKIAWLVVISAALLIVWRAASLLILVFGSVLGAVVFHAAARLFRRIGIRGEGASLILGILLVLSVVGLIIWLFASQFGYQIRNLGTELPAALTELADNVDDTPLGLTAVAAVRDAIDGAAFRELLGSLSFGVVEIFLNSIIVLVGALFFAASPDVYKRGLVVMTPPAAREKVGIVIEEIALALRLWLVAQLLCMASMGLLVAGGLWLIGVEGWAMLGLLAGLSEFVPYVGPLAAMVPTLALAAPEGGQMIGLVFVVYFAVRMIQTNLITPFVTRSVVSIPPALTLFVILGVGAVFGIYGLFFSAAMLVVAFVGIREIYLRDTLGEEGIEAIPQEVDEDEPQ
ncbi:AI-2E family transporter [Croceicoccus hydrothermalis]|uniref:AI-2E family transporter n=1 Tax=Croceicoccus hydrothermalis TaxID=2867964 RepID=UPI001EFB4878|nr:AI-2E family transporter [Croceicoccus hydrothermalis]